MGGPKPSDPAIEQVYFPRGRQPKLEEHDRVVPVPFLREGQPVGSPLTLQQGRKRVTAALFTLPWEGLRLSPGDPAIPTTFV